MREIKGLKLVKDSEFIHNYCIYSLLDENKKVLSDFSMHKKEKLVGKDLSRDLRMLFLNKCWTYEDYQEFINMYLEKEKYYYWRLHDSFIGSMLFLNVDNDTEKLFIHNIETQYFDEFKIKFTTSEVKELAEKNGFPFDMFHPVEINEDNE